MIFPKGKKVDAVYYQIDLEAPVTVDQVCKDSIDMDHPWHGRRTHKFVAVSFYSGSGHIFWTIFSRNGTARMCFPQT